MRGLNASTILRAQRGLLRRSLTSDARRMARDPPLQQPVAEDPRPRWVYVGTRLISFAVIPAVGLYSIFLQDFGEQEHVFQPIRRWVADGINAFFTLSPAEQKLLQQETQSEPTVRA